MKNEKNIPKNPNHINWNFKNFLQNSIRTKIGIGWRSTILRYLTSRDTAYYHLFIFILKCISFVMDRFWWNFTIWKVRHSTLLRTLRDQFRSSIYYSRSKRRNVLKNKQTNKHKKTKKNKKKCMGWMRAWADYIYVLLIFS